MVTKNLFTKILFFTNIVLLSSGFLFAADVVTDGNMELSGIVNWPHTDIAATNSSAKAGDQFQSASQSLKGTSATGRRVNVGWYNTQTVGLINDTDTVTVSFWYGYQYMFSIASATGTFYFDIKPSSGTWATDSTNVWSASITPNVAFQSGIVSGLDISSSITVSQSYDIRLRFEGGTGNSPTAYINTWWDDVILDVVAPLQCTHAAPTVDVTGTTAKTGCTGDQITYSFSVTSNCNGPDCTDETFNLTYGDSAANFSSSGPASVVLAPGATSSTLTLTVDILPGAIGPDTTTITATPAAHPGDAASNTEAVTSVDLTPPGSALFTSCNPVSSSQIDLGWTNPVNADFQNVIIVRGPDGGACPVFTPVDGNTYSVGAQGADTIIYIGNASPHSDTGLTIGTAYCYEIWAYDNCENYASEDTTSCATPSVCTHAAPTVDVINTTAKSGCAGSSVTYDFTVTNNCTSICGNETFILGYADSAANFSSNGPADTGSLAPGATTGTLTLTVDILAGAVGPNVTTITASLAGHTDGTNVEATTSVDLTAPSSASFTSCTPVSDSQIDLAWNNPGDADFQNVIIVRGPAGGVCPVFAPVDGNTYAVGAQGVDTVIYVGSASPQSDIGLAAGTTYCYAIWAYDNCENYSAQNTTNCATLVNATSAGAASAAVDSCSQITVTVPYTNDANGNLTVTVEKRVNCLGGYIVVCSGISGASPIVCVDSGLAEDTDYCYRITFTDPDGVTGTNPQTLGPVRTPLCPAGDVTIISNSAQINSCNQITVTSTYTGDFNNDSSTQVEYDTNIAFPSPQTACAALTGTSPRQCIVSGLLPSTPYYIRITYSDPDGVNGTNPEIIGPFNTPACGGDIAAPTIMVVSPTQNAVIGGTDRIKIQVYDLADPNPTVQCAVDGGGFSSAVLNANYICGTNCGVYEFDIDTTILSNNTHFVTVRATDAAANVSEVVLNFTANNDGLETAGAGNLLRRTHGSQTCVDCHDLQTHSSQYTDTGYGTWAMDCLKCHTPHQTRNIYLVNETVQTPNSGAKPVLFKTLSGAAGVDDSGVMADASNTTYNEVCEVCHTKTAYFRNDGSQPGSNHNNASDCTGCHSHGKGFAPSGCAGCHSGPPSDAATGMAHQIHWDYALYGTEPSSLSDVGNYSTGTYYRFGCGKCHYDDLHTSNAQAGTLVDPHVVGVPLDDNTVNPKLGLGALYSYGAPAGTENPISDYFQYSYGTCSDVYCHGEFPGGNNANNPLFDASAVQNCASCHIPDGGSHTTHVATRGYACQYCHESTANAVPSVINKAIHVDGTVHWDLAEENTILQGINPTYNSANAGTKEPPSLIYSTCNGVRCHSDGAASRQNWSGSPAPVYQTPTWGGVALGCNGCHGNTGATLTGGKHPTHLGSNGWGPGVMACTDCHTSSAAATHVNGTVDFRDTNPLSATTACDNCHSTATVNSEVGATIAKNNWHTPGFRYTGDRCLLCHNTADPASVNFDGTGGNASAKNTYYNTVGHGKDSGTYISTGNTAPNMVCTVCHNNTVSEHIGGAVTDRLQTVAGDALTYTSTISEVCLDCHVSGGSGGTLGWDALAEASVHSGGVTGKYNTAGTAPSAFPVYGDSANYTLNPGYQCQLCHDPHGTSNYAMINAAINGGLGAGDVAVSVAGRTGLDPTSANADGACDACHSGAADSHPDTNRINNHQYGNDCAGCHDHTESFKGGGEPCDDTTTCEGCHSGIAIAMTAVDNTRYRHYLTSTGGAYSDNNPLDCLSCHVSHNSFSPECGLYQRAANLKEDGMDVTSPVSTADDFDNAASNDGACKSCHVSAQTKTYTRPDGTTSTVIIGTYSGSAHDYNATETYSDSSVFNANCIKCHSDNADPTATRENRATSTFKFETHSSSSPLISFAAEENMCYACHDGTERYNTAGVTPDNIQAEIARASNHPVGNYSGIHSPSESTSQGWNTGATRHIECADCHDAHEATTVNPLAGTWGVSVTNGASARDVSYSYKASAGVEYEVCLKCHSTWAFTSEANAPNTISNPGSAWKETDIGKDFDINNYSYHPLFAAGRNQPGNALNPNWSTSAGRKGGSASGLDHTFVDGWTATSLVTCTDCHNTSNAAGPQGPHGSAYPWILKGADTSVIVTLWNGTTVTPNNGLTGNPNFCVNCHRFDVYKTGSYQNLSRVGHQGGTMNAACNDASVIPYLNISCINCHGGRTPGGVHGSNLGVGSLGTSEQGKRMMNGASWVGHTLGDVSGSLTCYTLSSGTNMSTCTKHPGGRAASPYYYYAWN